MYPSIKLKLVIKAVRYFSGGVSREEEKRIENCFDMIKFGMSSTVLNFKERYYEYDGKVDAMKKGLKIGGFKSAWLADLVIA